MNTILKECKQGKHSLVVIMSNNTGYDMQCVVRWCQCCGSIVVDADYDGRTNVGYYRKMKAPAIFEMEEK
jgi:hypothetical protein